MRRILILTYHRLWPPATGFHHRVCNLIRHLRRRGHSVGLLVVRQSMLSAREIETQRQNVDNLHVLSSAGTRPLWYFWLRRRLIWMVRATASSSLETFARRAMGTARRILSPARRFLKGLKARLAWFPKKKPADPMARFQYASRQQDRVREIIERGEYEVIIVENILMASAVRKKASGDRLWIIDTHDVMHERTDCHRRLNLPLPDTHAYTRQEEIDVLKCFDLIVAIQDSERKTFEEMLPEKRVICAGVDFPVKRMPTTANQVALVGTSGLPNVHGTERFLREAWPQVVRVSPDAVLRIYGTVCSADGAVRAAAGFPESVLLHGYVDDLTEAYQAAVVIAPLWAGSGLKIKVVEALCHGKAVITTPIGAQGMADGAGTAFRVAETPADFAGHILDLLDDPRKREALAEAAYHYAARKFSEDTVYKELDQVLHGPVVPLAKSA